MKKKAETQGYNPIASDREGKKEKSVKREEEEERRWEGTAGGKEGACVAALPSSVSFSATAPPAPF